MAKDKLKYYSKFLCRPIRAKGRLYRKWVSMRSRCYNKNSRDYHWYGAKGVTVCQEWLNDYSAFYDWAIQNGFSRWYRYIDRINPFGNYEPANCRFVGRSESCTNRRRRFLWKKEKANAICRN